MINDYKLIRQSCEKCTEFLKKDEKDPLRGSADPIKGEERIRELELELAQTKLALVEAERPKTVGRLG
nr:unnamed protein product [Callosobruchus chinensis]